MESLEDLSDENLIWFYREELERVNDGVRATLLIPITARRKLFKLGILEHVQGSGGLILSTMGRETLDGYKRLSLSGEWDKEG